VDRIAETSTNGGAQEDRLRVGPEFVRRGARSVTSSDVARVVARAADVERRVRRGPLRRLAEDARDLLALLRDWRAGRYRAVPFGTIAAAAFALLYVLNPFDLVPDALPVLGQLDDLAVLSAALLLMERDLEKYRAALRGDAPPADA
jgi:uncharacterized membrane protein YkvA (DUF1232 family)